MLRRLKKFLNFKIIGILEIKVEEGYPPNEKQLIFMNKVILRHGWINAFLNLKIGIFIRVYKSYLINTYKWYFEGSTPFHAAYILRNAGLCYTEKEKVVLTAWLLSENRNVPVHMQSK